MPERTEVLIRSLTRELQPVRRLPRLGRVAASIAGLTFALVAAQIVFAWIGPAPWPKPDFGGLDAWTIAVHALLFSGALVFALGVCVPGRERLARSGVIALALALAALAGIAAVRIAGWPGAASLAPGWLAATVTCSLHAVLPAVLPALLFARFASRAVPRQLAVAIAVGAAAPLGGLTQPGILGCAYPDELHQTIGHLLTPVLGAALVLVIARAVLLTLRRFERV